MRLPNSILPGLALRPILISRDRPRARVRAYARGVALAPIHRLGSPPLRQRRPALHPQRIHRNHPLASEPPTIEPSDISPVSIVDEMKTSYLDYAMSVIVAPGAARRARRPEAGPPPHPLRLPGRRLRRRPALSQVGQDRRRRDGQLPPARRQRDLRRARADDPGLVDARAADRRPGQFRLDGPRSAGRRCATPRRGSPRWR